MPVLGVAGKFPGTDQSSGEKSTIFAVRSGSPGEHDRPLGYVCSARRGNSGHFATREEEGRAGFPLVGGLAEPKKETGDRKEAQIKCLNSGHKAT